VPLAEMSIPPARVEPPVDEPFAPEPVPAFGSFDDIGFDPGIENRSDGGDESAIEIAFDIDDDTPFEREPLPTFDPEPLSESPSEPAAGDDFTVESIAPSALESGTLPISAPATEGPADAEDDFDFDLLDDAEVDIRSEELPLPTMTLARLALDQADLELAEKTLRGVLERDPSNAEASRLLAGLSGGAGFDVATIQTDEKTVDARARALQRWLEAVRLASERLKP
jgi:hypothetical protein